MADNNKADALAAELAKLRDEVTKRVTERMIAGLRFGAGKEWLKEAAEASAAKKAAEDVAKIGDDDLRVVHAHMGLFS